MMNVFMMGVGDNRKVECMEGSEVTGNSESSGGHKKVRQRSY